MAKNISSEKPMQSTEAEQVIKMLMVRPARLESADIETYRTAVNQAKMGYYTKWFDLVDNLMQDGFLKDQIGKLVGKVTNAELQFQIDGKSVDVINELIDTPEFEELLTEIVYSKVFGKTVINTAFVPEFEIFSFPRQHIHIKNVGRPLADRQRVITTMPGGVTGYEYADDEFILEFGKDGDLGLMYCVAQYVIYKRGNFGDWAEWAEIFGRPFVLGKYNSTDTNARDALFASLSQMGGKPVLAAPKEADIEVIQMTGGSNGDLYQLLRTACNEEIMISILGETMTTVSGSSRSQSETHADTLNDKAKTMCRYVQRMLNKKFVPLLIKRGYPAAGGKFTFPQAAQELTVADLSALSKLMRIPSKWAHDKYAIPMAEGDEEVLGESQTTKPDPNTPSDNTPQLDENGNPIPPTPEPPSTEIKPKTAKLSDITHFSLSDIARELPNEPSFIEKISGFFADARTMWSRATNQVTQSVTERSRGLSLADKSTNYTAGINIDKLFNQALNDIYAQYELNPEEMPLVSKPLFDISNKSYQKAIDKEFKSAGVEFGKKNESFIAEFKQNAAVFSAFKNHRQTSDIVAQLIDADGNLLSFDKFRKAVLGTTIKADYNQNWLKTEYNMAVRSSRMAAKLKQFEATKRLYPNLEFMPSTAAEPREAHKEWYGTILPMDHPWWKDHTPPVDWGCECSIKNTDKPVTDVPEGGETIDPVFAFNPADTAEIVNMKEHPYVKNTDAQSAEMIMKLVNELLNENAK